VSNIKTDNFRPIEFWKASIMTLPDNAFFELIRTVFGKVKTPFNKQILTGDLEKFLLSSDIQKNIASYIDRQDARIIAAVALLNEPNPGDLETFFSDEFNYAELNEILVNLEERFILYRFQDEGKNQSVKRLALNPVFKSILSPFIADNSLLFPSVHIDETFSNEKQGANDEKNPFNKNINSQNVKAPFSYDDRILAVLLSFVSMNEAFFKSNGGGSIRQKVSNSAKTMFPSLAMEILIGGLQVLGLFSIKNERLLPDYRRFSAFGRLSRQERAEYYTSGIFFHSESARPKGDGVLESLHESTISPWLLRTKVRSLTSFIHRFCRMLDPDRLYSFSSLRKLAYILDRDNSEISIDRLIEVMGETGLLVSMPGKYWRKRSFAEPLTKETPSNESPSLEGAIVAMDTPFSLVVYPEVEYNDLIKISAFCHVTEAGLNIRFDLNRDSAVSAFNLGIGADSIIDLLQRLSRNRIDDNLIYALHDWEKSHREVTLRQGLILTLSQDRQYLAETKPLSMFIKETLAPGIYMLPTTLEDRAVRALQKAGVSIIARHGEHAEENRFMDSNRPIDGFYGNFFPSLHATAFNSEMTPKGSSQDAKAKAEGSSMTSADILIESFHSSLDQMRMDKEKHDELAARIDRRLILCESQLKDAVLRYEKLEARGMDYNGKTLIAKQAISMQSLLEVTWPVKQKQERVLGIPKTLEKTGTESILVIKPMDGKEETIRIPLGKISLLRRIKRSIFETNIV